MAASTRQQFKEYCLRNLGAPVLEINVDEDQLEDRIDEALEFWRLYHSEGIEKVYLKQKINASELILQESIADTFNLSSKIVGATSGATAMIVTQLDKSSTGTSLIVRGIDPENPFIAGETITSNDLVPITATLIEDEDDFMVIGEVDKKYIELPDIVYGVIKLLPFSATSSSKSMFDIQYQLRLNDLYDLASTSIIYYKQVMSHLALLDLELNGKPMMRFNRMQGRVYPDINWQSDIILGGYVILECYRALDPTTWTRVWNEPWLKHYATALFKRQWGQNLSKFSGLQLPGGVTLDGAAMYQLATQEIKELEDQLMTKQAPLEWFMG